MALRNASVPPLLTVPNELLLEVTDHLTSPGDVASILRVNRRMATVLDHVLDRFAFVPWPDAGQMRIPPLHQAANRGHVGRAKRLLRLGVDIDTLSGTKTTALAGAVANCKVNMIRFLLQRGASIHVADNIEGPDPIAMALGQATLRLMRKDVKGLNSPMVVDGEIWLIIRTLLDHQILAIKNGSAPEPEMAKRWLRIAVHGSGNDDKSVHLLLDHKIFSESYSTRRVTALYGYAATTVLLLGNEADPPTETHSGKTPGDFAIRNRHREVLKYLLKCVPEGITEYATEGKAGFSKSCMYQ